MSNTFNILERKEIPELNAVGVFAEHKKTGLQVFHLLNDDEENLFSFGFLTPQKNSTGVPHIIEHTVLCGSKNYPISDPFLTLMKQNLTTFLNAMTFPDKTVYPASSIVEEEYFTAMSVYGDAVFFPLITREAFEQDGWRLEFNKNNEPTIQGVVFNEMQAVYSDFNAVSYQTVKSEFLKGTPYEYDSGGDPRVIPELSYEEYKAFYKKFYHPSNCRIFLIGNIPTEKQLDFLDKKFLQYFERGETVEPIKPLKPFSSPKKFTATAPSNTADDDETNLLLTMWSIGETQNTKELLLNMLISDILMGNDGAVLSKAILDSGLGELFSYNGVSSSCKNTILNFGVTKVKKGNEQKIENLIFETLNNFVQAEPDKKIIETALNRLEFENREIIRIGNSPFSLELMQKVYNSWLYGGSPFDGMNYISEFEALRDEILGDKNYLNREIKKRLIENKTRCMGIVSPDKNFSLNLKNTINEKAKTLAEQLSETEKTKLLAKQDSEKMQDEPKNLIPHIAAKDLPAITDAPKKKIVHIGNCPAVVYEQNTNGISYVNIAIPFDNIPDEYYDYIKLYVETLSDIGMGNLSWHENLQEQNRIFGGMNVSLLLVDEPFENFTELDKQNILQKDAVLSRDWILISVKMLERFIDEGVHFVATLLQKVRFDDSERLLDILKQIKTNFENIPATNGHNLALVKSLAGFSGKFANQERLTGVSQLKFIKSLLKKVETDKNFLKTLCEKLAFIHEQVLAGGLLFHITSEAKNLTTITNSIEKNFSAFKSLQAKTPTNKSNTNIKNNFTEKLQLLPAQIQVAHSVYSFEFLPYEAKTFGKGSAFKSWLSSGPLWESIRVAGGAYGAFAISMDSVNVFSFITYRDPNALNSIAKIKKVLSSILEKNLSDEEMEKIIVGAYSNEVMPKTPYQKSFNDFTRLLKGKPANAKVEEVKGLTETTFADFKNFAKILLEENRRAIAVVLDNKSSFEDLSAVENQFDKVENLSEI